MAIILELIELSFQLYNHAALIFNLCRLGFVDIYYAFNILINNEWKFRVNKSLKLSLLFIMISCYYPVIIN